MDPYPTEGTIRDHSRKVQHCLEQYRDVFFMDHIVEQVHGIFYTTRDTLLLTLGERGVCWWWKRREKWMIIVMGA